MFFFVLFITMALVGSVLYCYKSSVCECKCWSQDMRIMKSYQESVVRQADRPAFVIKSKPARAHAQDHSHGVGVGSGPDESAAELDLEAAVGTGTLSQASAHSNSSTSSLLPQYLHSWFRGEDAPVEYAVRPRDDVDLRTDWIERSVMVGQARSRMHAGKGVPAYFDAYVDLERVRKGKNSSTHNNYSSTTHTNISDRDAGAA